MVAAATDESATEIAVGFDDFEMLSTEGVDVFVLDLNRRELVPFYITVDGRRFALQRDTYLLRGHGAEMPEWVREQEAEGRLVLLGERGSRYLVYLFDPEAEEQEDEAEASEGGSETGTAEE